MYFRYLNENQFTGSIPKEIGLLTKLEELYEKYLKLYIEYLSFNIFRDLSQNQLTGSIPKELSSLICLEYL